MGHQVIYYPDPNDSIWNEEIDSILQYIQGDKVLDIGCGGRSIKNVTRMDIDPGVNPDLVADASQLPFEDNYFDSAYSIHSIQYFQNTQAVIEEWLRVIKPGGYLCIVVPNAKYIPIIGSTSFNCSHVYDFTPHAFRHLVELAGFDIASFGDASPEWSFRIILKKGVTHYESAAKSSQSLKTNIRFCLVSGLQSYGRWTIPANEIRAWSYALEGDVHCGTSIQDYTHFDQYDVTMIELTPPMLPVALNLKAKSKTTVVGLVEGELLPRWPPQIFADYVHVLNTIDMVGVINRKSYDIMRRITKKPVHFIGIPYPLQWAKANVLPNRSEGVIELGSSPADRGGVWSLAAFNQLDTNGVCYIRNENDMETTAKMSNGMLQLKNMRDWPTYYREHSQYYTGLHLDDRATWGRFPLDCAAAGIPCVSTYGSHTQSVLFPDLTVHYYEVDKAVELCKKLLKDRAFYEYVISYANEQIKQFDLIPTKERFLKLFI